MNQETEAPRERRAEGQRQDLSGGFLFEWSLPDFEWCSYTTTLPARMHTRGNQNRDTAYTQGHGIHPNGWAHGRRCLGADRRDQRGG